MATLRFFSPSARGCFNFGIAKVGIFFYPANFSGENLEFFYDFFHFCAS